jgi:mannan endo-1,4-beta-mannosidase
LAETKRLGRHRQAPQERFRTPARRHLSRLTAIIAAAGVATAIVATFGVYSAWRPAQADHSAPHHSAPQRNGLPTTPGSYIGLYTNDAPDSYAGVKAFTTATGVKPRVVVYYSGWLEPFQVGFATTASNAAAVPLVQIEPNNISIAAIAAGQYDNYLAAYAKAVRAHRHPVILSFGHEMNGYWYSWGYTHTSPAVFVAAWRHIVTLFRTLGARNVTWLWTTNVIHERTRVPSPGPWWPGNSYVNWVGIDGYFTNSSVFASEFGPTIVYLRTLTHDPILIAETSATPVASQPAKIADLFAGIHLYGLLGFVWFDSLVHKVDWRLSSPAAIAAFRQGAKKYLRVES